jgi:5'(3')-deoxyribonucleotidase
MLLRELYNQDTDDLIEALDASATIYVDMDGVLADFFGVWTKMMGVDSWKDIQDIPVALDRIKKEKDFWINLPLTNNAMKLLDTIKKVKGSYVILSTPLEGDANSEPGKMEWIKKHLGSFMPSDVILTQDKTKYATNGDKPNALIDDYGANIAKWEAAGGIGIKHSDGNFARTADALADLDEEDLDEGPTWARSGKKVVRKYRCAGGPRKNRIVSQLKQCFAAPNVKKRMALKRIKARLGSRITRKAKKTKRMNPASIRVQRLNKATRR